MDASLTLEDVICQSASSSLCDSEQTSQPSQKDGGKYFESDGELGYRKGESFIAVTNFYMRCKGYVAKDTNSTSANGFLAEVIPKDNVRLTDNEDELEEGESYNQDMRLADLLYLLTVLKNINIKEGNYYVDVFSWHMHVLRSFLVCRLVVDSVVELETKLYTVNESMSIES